MNHALFHILYYGGKCGTCKHWDARPASLPFPVHDMPPGKFGRCKEIGFSYGGIDPYRAEALQALATDSEYCSGELITAENFVCALWTARGGTKDS